MLYDLKVGLTNPGPEALTTALPSEVKARHRRFFKNKQRRGVDGDVKRQTPAPVETVESEDSGSETDGIDSPSSADETETLSAGVAATASQVQSAPPTIGNTTPPPALEPTSTAQPADSPSPTPEPLPSPSPSPAPSPAPTTSPSPASSSTQAPIALPIVESSRDSSSSPTANSNPPLKTIPLPTNTSSRREPVATSSAIISSTTNVIQPAQSEPKTTIASTLQTTTSKLEPITSTPVASGSSTTLMALKDQQQGTAAANLAAASGSGSTMVSGLKSPIDGKMVAGVVFGIVGAALIILFVVWRLMKARRAQDEAGDLEKPTMAQMMFGQTRKAADNPNDDTSSVSRLWGGATTTGAPTEAGYHQAYIPASQQKGGIHDATAYNETRFSQLESQLPKPQAYLNVTPPVPAVKAAADGRAAPRTDDNGFIQPPNRWFGRNSSVSQASIPRFRSIKSWASDQRTRTQNTIGTEQGDQLESSKWSVSTDSRDMSGSNYGQR